MAPMMKAMQVTAPQAPLSLVELPVPEPGVGEVRIKVAACGICHSDAFLKEGHWPGLHYPRTPGHEVAGTIDAVGPHVSHLSVGDKVGVGWHGGHCFTCDSCRRGDFVTCENARVTGLHSDGGYAEYMIARHEAVARMPDGLDLVEAAPLLCAGITTFNALRNAGARGGDLVAVQGLGGLGHLGVQFAAKLGFRTVAISRGADKAELAASLGAHHYIDSTAGPAAKALKALGGAKVILATAPNSKAIATLTDGLAIGGRLVVVAADATPMMVSPLQLIGGRKSVAGWPSGSAMDSEDTLRFSALTGAKAIVERFPLIEAEAAYQRMMKNEARFRVVLEIG